MKIKKAILLLSCITCASQVYAYDGQITFEGSVTDVTCIITGGEEGGTESTTGSFTINLPQVKTSALAKNGDTAGVTGFYIKLTGSQCADGKTANVKFEKASSDINSTTGFLNNTLGTGVGGATNVQVALLNKDKTALNLNTVSSTHQPVVIAGNAARFDYWAQYHATGQSTPGYVKSLVAYTVVYN